MGIAGSTECRWGCFAAQVELGFLHRAGVDLRVPSKRGMECRRAGFRSPDDERIRTVLRGLRAGEVAHVGIPFRSGSQIVGWRSSRAPWGQEPLRTRYAVASTASTDRWSNADQARFGQCHPRKHVQHGLVSGDPQ